ncbi:MAG: hypothetical protein ACYTGR_14005 [Planctomycetota bacterium]
MNEPDKVVARFVNEATKALVDVENDLLEIEEQGPRLDPGLLKKVSRSILALQGVPGFSELHSIGALTHEVESVLTLIRVGEVAASKMTIDPLLRATNCLTSLVANAETSNDVDISEHVRALADVTNTNTDASPELIEP